MQSGQLGEQEYMMSSHVWQGRARGVGLLGVGIPKKMDQSGEGQSGGLMLPEGLK